MKLFKLVLLVAFSLIVCFVHAENPASENYELIHSNIPSNNTATPSTSSNYTLQSSSIEAYSGEKATSENYNVLPGYYHGEITDGIVAPENVVISVNRTNVQLSWDPVPDADSYKVYSSDDPVIDFTEDTSGTFINESWSTPIPAGKKFYYVKAIKQLTE